MRANQLQRPCRIHSRAEAEPFDHDGVSGNAIHPCPTVIRPSRWPVHSCSLLTTTNTFLSITSIRLRIPLSLCTSFLCLSSPDLYALLFSTPDLLLAPSGPPKDSYRVVISSSAKRPHDGSENLLQSYKSYKITRYLLVPYY